MVSRGCVLGIASIYHGRSSIRRLPNLDERGRRPASVVPGSCRRGAWATCSYSYALTLAVPASSSKSVLLHCIGNDQQLFDRIREEYLRIRGKVSWYQKTAFLQTLSLKFRWLTDVLMTVDLTIPNALQFVKFRLVPVKTCSTGTLRRLANDSTTRNSRAMTHGVPRQMTTRIAALCLCMTCNTHNKICCGNPTKGRYQNRLTFEGRRTRTMQYESRCRGNNRRDTPKPPLGLRWKERVPGSSMQTAVECCRDSNCQRREEFMA